MTGALKGEEKVEEGEMKMMMMELLLDADGAACCRLLHSYLRGAPSSCWFRDGCCYTFLQKVSRGQFDLSLTFYFSRNISLS